MAEMVNEMGDVSMRFSSVSDDKAEVSEIKDYTAQPHGSPPVNKDGDIPLCVFPSAESLLETLRRSCTPTAHESGGIQAAPPVPRAPPAPVDVWQGQPVLSEEHKRLLKRLFTVDKEGSMEPGQMDVQMDVVPVSCPVEFDPTRLEQHCEPSGGNVSLDGRPMFSGLADEMPESPFVSQVEAPPLPSPSDIPPLGPISPSGVQLSPIFSQVNLESLLSVMGSFTSSDLVDFINTSGIRMVDVSESNLPPPAPMDED
ncbi:unnamed protein product [Ostreobium quekettii]|uniref:Uncharacterized protein n=1 Tax=Ostreobium quekettii TaxID=121088 RepID=A0A8S1IZA0_9CHLO|nr:unnamed protein product [Ostreobium quekettii]